MAPDKKLHVPNLVLLLAHIPKGCSTRTDQNIFRVRCQRFRVRLHLNLVCTVKRLMGFLFGKSLRTFH